LKTKSKVLLDEWFGRLMVYALNLAARILGRILGIDHSFDKIPERIVVCKFLGMGSIIQATPLVQTLRQSFPRAQIYFVTSKANEKLLRRLASINDVWTVDDSGLMALFASTLKLLRKFWKKKTDLYIDLETYSYFSTAIATLSLSRNRLGFYRAERNIRMGVYTHMMFFNSRAPIAESYLQMARLVGCREISSSLYAFRISKEEEESCKKILAAINPAVGSDYMIINPNASDLRIERRWPLGNFARLIHKLSADFPLMDFYIIGSGAEKEWTGQLMNILNEQGTQRVYNTAGSFSLGELFALLKGARLMLTNDTGPMHMSFALRKNTVCLFGPASPSQYGQNPYAFGIYKNIYCSPCVHEFLTPPCKGDNQCMKLIDIEEVEILCRRLLSHEEIHPPAYPDFPQQFAVTGRNQALGLVDRS
jgi:ADP-heptose:LPS heptosyltransferase